MKNYLKYGDVNSFYVWTMAQKLHANDFKWLKETSQFNENVIKIHNEDSGIGHFIEADVQYPEKLHELNNDLLFLSERVKIKKLVTNLHYKEEYVIHVRNLKQVLNHEPVFTKMHRVIKFNQKAWLKSYIDMNTGLRKNAKNDFGKK